MKKAILFTFLAVAACGSSSSKPTTTRPPEDPAPVNEPPAPVSGTEPAKPADPVKPVEPLAPAVPDPATITAELLAAETGAFEKAKPVFDKRCASCHAKDGKKTSAKKREHFDMTAYPFGGHHAMEISGEIREVLGMTGKKPTMPADKKGVVKGDELALIAAWADAFDASHKGGAHEHHGDHEHGGHKH